MSLKLYAGFQRDLASGVTSLGRAAAPSAVPAGRRSCLSAAVVPHLSVRAREVSQHLAGSLLRGRCWVRTSDLLGVNEARSHCAIRPRGGDGDRTRVQGFAGPCLNHSATPPAPTFPAGESWLGHPKNRAGQGPAGRNPAPPSGRRDSNPRPSPWQGDALPTEPRPHAGALPSERIRPVGRAFRTVADPGPASKLGTSARRPPTGAAPAAAPGLPGIARPGSAASPPPRVSGFSLWPPGWPASAPSGPPLPRLACRPGPPRLASRPCAPRLCPPARLAGPHNEPQASEPTWSA